MNACPTPFKLSFPDARQPSGPDGRGWNRLSINTLSPTDRCMLRPRSRQACLDLARGMARMAPITTYSPCEGSACAECKFNSKREPWVSSWVISEDSNRGGVWLMGSKAPDAFGHYFPSWEALSRAHELPPLKRVIDPHWGVMYEQAQPADSVPGVSMVHLEGQHQ